MIELKFSLVHASDALTAARALTAFADAWSDAEAPASQTGARRQRVSKGESPCVTVAEASDVSVQLTPTPERPDPAALYELLALTDTGAAATGVVASAEPEADKRARDELETALRSAALKKGALWLRKLLDKGKIRALSEMTDAQICGALAA